MNILKRFINWIKGLFRKLNPVRMMIFASSDRATDGIKPKWNIGYDRD